MKHAFLPLVVAVCAACGHRPPAVPAPAPAPTRTAAESASDSLARHAQPVRLDTVRLTLAGAAPADQIASPGKGDMEFARYDRIDWPGPNAYRGADGRPGPAYWQQRADYSIAATLDTASKTLRGTMTIKYRNNSPDTLRFVWLQVDQNLYRPGSKGAALFAADSRFGARDFVGGYDITNLRVNGRPAEGKTNDTMMRIDLDAPIRPKGGTAVISMAYSFRIPVHGSDRMGRDSTLYEMAQWFPRMAVYDDVKGWNTDPYLGQGEFYLEYGNYDYAVTLPAGYIVAGSGVLQNAPQVLAAEQRRRLARAARSDTVVQVITAAEAKERTARAVPGTKTWRFHAANVHDVAWCAAPDFRWDATSWRGTLTQALYQWPKAGAEWEQAAEGTQFTIRTYSELFYKYPYPVATNVATEVGGMEYPMLAMDAYTDPSRPGDVFITNDHEQGHEWFPMVVGSNERRYAWMDEGINTFINTFSQERRYQRGTHDNGRAAPPQADTWTKYMDDWRMRLAQGTLAPLMTHPDRIPSAGLGTTAYRKPAAVLLALRNAVVGREAFDRAFREYIRRWAFKHPTPADFFRTVENVSGEDLSWYWRSFFYTNDVLDVGIDTVRNGRAGDGQQYAVVTVRRHTPVLFPVMLRLKLADGTTKDARFPVDAWAGTDRFDAAVAVNAPATGARLWPDPFVPDWNSANDTWGDAPPADAPGFVTGGGLMQSNVQR